MIMQNFIKLSIAVHELKEKKRQKMAIVLSTILSSILQTVTTARIYSTVRKRNKENVHADCRIHDDWSPV